MPQSHPEGLSAIHLSHPFSCGGAHGDSRSHQGRHHLDYCLEQDTHSGQYEIGFISGVGSAPRCFRISPQHPSCAWEGLVVSLAALRSSCWLAYRRICTSAFRGLLFCSSHPQEATRIALLPALELYCRVSSSRRIGCLHNHLLTPLPGLLGTPACGPKNPSGQAR